VSDRSRGELALVLHSHMPYVEGFDTWPFGEEWLWEAVACVYLPLLEVLDGAPVTLGLTPVLCDQLEALDGEAGDRYLSFLRETRAEVHEEDSAGLDRGDEPELAAEVRRAGADYREADRRTAAASSGSPARSSAAASSSWIGARTSRRNRRYRSPASPRIASSWSQSTGVSPSVTGAPSSTSSSGR